MRSLSSLRHIAATVAANAPAALTSRARAVIGICLVIGAACATAGCAPSPADSSSEAPKAAVPAIEEAIESAAENRAGAVAGAEATVKRAAGSKTAEQGLEAEDSPRRRERMPLQWDANDAVLVGHQGSTALWGSCGECCIANTLNLVTGSAYSEADIVGFVAERGFCDPDTGGMTLDDMADAYSGLLPPDAMGVHGFGGTYAPGPDEMAELLDDGVILNVSVYGAMMREGGHGGEGELYGTHWIVVHEAVRSDGGALEGFRVIDSASRITYLAAQELEGIYRGRDGTTIVDPACVEVFGWR